MRTVIKFILAAIIVLCVQASPVMAQKGGHHHGGHHKKGVVKHRPYRHRYHHHPHYYGKVYHPVWGPPVGYYRRWVFFPRYNFYWDNYNSMYVYWGNGVWVRTTSPPPAVININISNEKKYELDEPNDKVDDIYDSNTDHKKSYPEN